MKRALILTDGKAGHENQSRAFARGLGLEPTVAEIHFRSPAAKAWSYALDRLGIKTLRLFRGLPDASTLAGVAAVIGTGSGTFYAAKAMARRLGVRCGVVLYPRGYSLAGFDCILAPTFDRPPKRANVIGIPANLVANDEAFYAEGARQFEARHACDGRDAVAVVIGGPNKCSTMTAEWMRGELDRVFAETEGCERWVTTSRRTPPDVERVVESYGWDYALIYSKERFNPIPAFVKKAKRIYVTAESTGMLSEACTFGSAEVRVLDNLKKGKSKFRRFVDGLKSGGYADGTRKVSCDETFERARRLMLAEGE